MSDLALKLAFCAYQLTRNTYIVGKNLKPKTLKNLNVVFVFLFTFRDDYLYISARHTNLIVLKVLYLW